MPYAAPLNSKRSCAHYKRVIIDHLLVWLTLFSLAKSVSLTHQIANAPSLGFTTALAYSYADKLKANQLLTMSML